MGLSAPLTWEIPTRVQLEFTRASVQLTFCVLGPGGGVGSPDFEGLGGCLQLVLTVYAKMGAHKAGPPPERQGPPNSPD